jgi:hypothetical protein
MIYKKYIIINFLIYMNVLYLNKKKEDVKNFVSTKMFWKCNFKELIFKDCMIIISYGIISNKQMLCCAYIIN